jgi:hypothetical protein
MRGRESLDVGAGYASIGDNPALGANPVLAICGSLVDLESRPAFELRPWAEIGLRFPVRPDKLRTVD